MHGGFSFITGILIRNKQKKGMQNQRPIDTIVSGRIKLFIPVSNYCDGVQHAVQPKGFS